MAARRTRILTSALADLAGMYAAQQWAEGWAEADGDKRVRGKIKEMSDEIAEKMKQA